MTDTIETDVALTAFHEAGHAWAYHRHGLLVDEVLITPGSTDHRGVCNPPIRPIDITVRAWVAAAGPIAQAIHSWNTDENRCDLDDWDDYLTGAVWSGGDDDLQRAMGFLDQPEITAFIRSTMESEWDAITRLATALLNTGRIPGSDVSKILNTWQIGTK